MKFVDKVAALGRGTLRAGYIDVLQVNLGYKCNMLCKHCHVMAGPIRTEMMDRENIDAVIRVLEENLEDNQINVLDLTGGAPELNPGFQYLVESAGALGKHVVVRSNLTIFFEKGMENLPDLYRDNRVEIIASLPYYMEENVNRVRGAGTFDKSIQALRMLNSLGYAHESTGLKLNLVYNPPGAFLPPQQDLLEAEYKRELQSKFGISFNSLYTFTNMPIGRFKDFLMRTGNAGQYLNKLASSFNPDTLEGVMCRFIVSVAWDGKLFDCDFNQVIGLSVADEYPQHIRDFNYLSLSQRQIAVGEHCYGCTAGQGST